MEQVAKQKFITINKQAIAEAFNAFWNKAKFIVVAVLAFAIMLASGVAALYVPGNSPMALFGSLAVIAMFLVSAQTMGDALNQFEKATQPVKLTKN